MPTDPLEPRSLRTREIVATIPCPYCGARIGQPCTYADPYTPGRELPMLSVHDERHGFEPSFGTDQPPTGCPRCAQTSDTAGVCDPCRRLERRPQGETVRLFEPAPNQMPGQLALEAEGART